MKFSLASEKLPDTRGANFIRVLYLIVAAVLLPLAVSDAFRMYEGALLGISMGDLVQYLFSVVGFIIMTVLAIGVYFKNISPVQGVPFILLTAFVLLTLARVVLHIA